jgi:hypothetical protein
MFDYTITIKKTSICCSNGYAALKYLDEFIALCDEFTGVILLTTNTPSKKPMKHLEEFLWKVQRLHTFPLKFIPQEELNQIISQI